MGNTRSTRFLIDRIDQRLGNVEKEKKFDLIMVFVGFIIMAAGFILVMLKENVGTIGILYIFMIMAGLSLSYAMVREYIADCKKAKAQKSNK